ncbi:MULTISPECIES: ATP-grasp domain-containing protein [Methanobrevibacter]|uniref:ATP-grasp domain-containing protein n=1 Tax=Methanobrevibacter TaxID=2172 RepID=UPI0026EA8A36|nr:MULTISPECIES: ATP-grasp domain-containing protein [Methanobrevibacter]MBS7258043.1 ATP-grasp domain-containing protein [Methanobrevibacter sp.]MDY3097288.1 ATP-grasp domain-containing protein [Methanobrevibacter sp.]
MKLLFIGSRLYDDIDWYVKRKNIESILTESNENAINLDLPDQVFIVPRGMDGPKQVAVMQNVDAIVPLIGIDPPLIDVAHMKEEIEQEHGIPVIAANVRAVELTSNKIKTKKFYDEIGVVTPEYQILDSPDDLTLEFPVVLKQGEGQGGKDIKIAKSMDDVEEYFENFNQALCEQFIEGSEISIEVLGFNGEFVALPPIYKGETTLEGTHPLRKVKTGPCMVQGLDNNLVQHTAYKVAKNLDSDGIFEMDFMYSPEKDQLYAIEVNTRPNGTRYLTTATCGVNSLCELVNMAIGEFSPANISDKLEYHYSTEIPVGDYNGPCPNEPVKSFDDNDFVVHGPEGYQRLTARADSKKDLDNLISKLL